MFLPLGPLAPGVSLGVFLTLGPLAPGVALGGFLALRARTPQQPKNTRSYMCVGSHAISLSFAPGHVFGDTIPGYGMQP